MIRHQIELKTGENSYEYPFAGEHKDLPEIPSWVVFDLDQIHKLLVFTKAKGYDSAVIKDYDEENIEDWDICDVYDFIPKSPFQKWFDDNKSTIYGNNYNSREIAEAVWAEAFEIGQKSVKIAYLDSDDSLGLEFEEMLNNEASPTIDDIDKMEKARQKAVLAHPAVDIYDVESFIMAFNDETLSDQGYIALVKPETR